MKMLVKLIGRVLDVNRANGVSYVKFNDVEIGGGIDLSIPGGEDIKIDDLLEIDCICKPGKGKFGQYLKVDTMNKIKRVQDKKEYAKPAV